MSADGSTGSGSMPSAQAAPSLVGEVIDGRYKIVKKLGEGGMGEVYAADHVHIEKRFAIKLLKQEIVSNPEAVTRFRQEARSSSSIGHRNIIAVEDFGQLADGRIYMCMELLNGAALNDLILQPQPIERLLNIMIQTGHGLAAAHAKNIVHRDMKPENIFVTWQPPNNEDVPKILDFGIAKVAGNEGQNNLTRTGTIFGTPFYMAPEQALGNPVDARTDIYAVGVIMYEVFSGSLPFQGESFMGILTQHITTDPEPVAQRAAKAGKTLPPGLAEIITRCMQKNPAHRFATMDELVNALIPIYRSVAGAGMSTYMEAFPVGVSSAHPVPTPPPMTAAHLAQGANANSATMAVGGPPPGVGPSGPYGGYQQPQQQAYAQPVGAMGAASASASGLYDPSSSYVAPKKSKAGLIIAIFAILAVGGGVAAFVVLGDKSKGAGDGSGSQLAVGSDGSGSDGSGSDGSATTTNGSNGSAGTTTTTTGSNGSATNGSAATTGDDSAVIAASLAKMNAFADDACACADKACADKVMSELTAFAADSQKKYPELKPDEATLQKLTDAGERLGKCLQKVAAAGSGDLPPNNGSNGTTTNLPPDAGVVAAKTVPVLINANIASFEIWENGSKLAAGPDVVEVTEGTPRTLVLKAKGYKDSKPIVIDGKAKKVKGALKLIPTTNTNTNTNTNAPKCTNTKSDIKNPACKAAYCNAHHDKESQSLCDMED